MLINASTWRQHRFWFLVFVVGTLAASGWYFAYGWDAADWPGGSSLPGFLFGVVGGLICLFEFMLWLKKKVRVWRIGRAQAWMRAHIWLGLLCVPLLIYHSGFRLWGGTLSTVLMMLLLIVVASGIYGLVLQNLLPRKMLDELPAETIYSQIDHLSRRLHAEGARLIAQLCGEQYEEEAAFTEAPVRHVEGVAVVGAIRQVGLGGGKTVDTRVVPRAIAGAEPLGDFFRKTVAPYLLKAEASDSPLADPRLAGVLFQNVRALVPPETHFAVERLEESCNQRRQWGQQARIHFWLHSWLWVHFPLSVALIILMIVHVVVALKFY